MKIHPRVPIVQKASNDIEKAVLDIASRDGLTFIEVVGCLTSALQGFSKFALRAERHPENPDQPSGLE